MAQDYYETLQVHPKADSDAIQAAYERLRSMYDPARLEGVADELIAIAQQKLDLIEKAYAVLVDPVRRSDYDRSRGIAKPVLPAAQPEIDVPTGPAILDYRPLPPAGRSERPRDFVHEPLVRTNTPRTGTSTAIAVLAVLLSVVISSSLLITNWSAITAPATPAQPGVTPTASALDQYEIAIAQAKQATEQTPTDSQAWILLGNQLYDSAQIVRENMPDSTLYQQRLPRWLEASQAYDRALALQPDNASVRADRGASLCYYGAGVGDQTFITQGIKDVRSAVQARPDDPLIQLNLGNCLINALPPQTDEAIATWQRVAQLAPVDSAIAQRARELIGQYQQP
jgi:cytochrome c-type biogenesis protein CcmH/NrfG